MKYRSITILLILISTRIYAQKTVLPADNLSIYDFCLVDSGKYVLIADGNIIKLTNIENRTVDKEFCNGNKNTILSIDYCKKSNLLVSGGKDSCLCIWDVGLQKLLLSIHHNEIITKVKISEDGSHILYGDKAGNIRIFDRINNHTSSILTGNRNPILALDISSDSKYYVYNINKGSYAIRSFADSTCNTIVNAHKNIIRNLQFDESNTKLYSTSDDNTTAVYNIKKVRVPIKIDKKRSYISWLTALDIVDENIYAIGSITGRININTKYGTYKTNVKSSVLKIIIIRDQLPKINLLVATLNKGLLLINSQQLKF